MNNVNILKQMQKQHLEVKNNLDKLESLKWRCTTEIGTDSDKKQFNKLFKNTEKILRGLTLSYIMIMNQKIELPPEFIEIGSEINEFKQALEYYRNI